MGGPPLSRDARDLLVRPGNGSVILGAAHHLLYRPASALSRALSGHGLPGFLDPASLGRAVARATDRLDGRLAPRGKIFMRKEDLRLDADDLTRLGRKLEAMRLRDPERAKQIASHLRDLTENSYNPLGTIDRAVSKARKNKDFAITLHDVSVPSLTGEWGKTIKNVGTDVAAMYGAAEIVKHLQAEKRSNMSSTAVAYFTQAAEILESLPAKAEGQKYAAMLIEAGAIADSDRQKHARIFEETYKRSPEDAQAIFSGMLRGGEFDTKAASLGEPVVPEQAAPGVRGASFDQMCLDAYHGRGR